MKTVITKTKPAIHETAKDDDDGIDPDVKERAIELLTDAGQESLLKDLETWSKEARNALYEQVIDLDLVTPNGLVDYCNRGR